MSIGSWAQSVWRSLLPARSSCPCFSLLETLMTQLHELGAQLNALAAQLAKAQAEILGKIAELETQLTQTGDLPDDIQEALDALKAHVQALDDVVPDVPAPTPAEDEAPV